MVTGKTIATTREIVSLTGFSEVYLGRLERERVICRSGRGKWPLLATIHAIIQHLRATNRRGGAGSDALRAARAEEIRIRVAERMKDLIPVTDAAAHMDVMTGLTLTELSGLPARCTRDLALRRRIEDEVFAMRERLAKRMDEIGKQLLGGRTLDEALKATKALTSESDADAA
jgi:hypothetical protein